MFKHEKSSHIHACHELASIVRDFMRRRSPWAARTLHRELREFYSTHGLGLLESFARVPDVKFIFQADALSTLRPHMVGKKSALYSACSLCILPSLFHLGRPRFESAEIFCHFIESNYALVRRGRLIPFPSIETTPPYGRPVLRRWMAPEIEAIKRKLDEDRVSSYAETTHALPVFGNHATLVAQLNEDLTDAQYAPAGTRSLFLPTLDGLEQETLLQVLEDNDDPTVRFRSAFHSLLKDVSPTDSDRKILDALERVDEEVRDLDTRMHAISRDRLRSGMEATVGIVTTGLSMFLPDWLPPTTVTALGSVTILEGARGIAKVRADASAAKAGAFYLPWLIHAKHSR